MASFEREILIEAKAVTGNTKLKMKDILEWTTGKCEVVLGEKVYHLPGMNVNIAILEK